MATRIVVPELGESVIEATVSRWRKQPGDAVAAGEAVVELETEKVNLEVGAEKAGVLTRIERAEGEDVHIGDVLGIIEERQPAEARPAPADGGAPAARPTADQPPAPAAPPAETETQAPPSAAPGAERITPVARRLAEAKGIDPAQVPAGAGRRVTKQDVEAYLAQQAAPAARAAPAAASPGAPVSSAAGRPEERVRLSRRRRTIARRLVEAQHTAAMLTTFNEIDLGAVM